MYKRSREVPCISLLVAAGFVLDAIFPLEYFSNMAVMDEIVSQRVEFSCALSVFCVRAFFLSANLTSERIFSTRLLG